MTTLLGRLTGTVTDLGRAPAPRLSGKVLRYDGLIAECAGFTASPGTRCEIETEDGGRAQGEIVGFADGRNLLFLDTPGARVGTHCAVHRIPQGHEGQVGEAL